MRNPDKDLASVAATTSPTDLLDQLSVPSRISQRPSLDRMRQLLAEIGNPHAALRVLHIGGTSGKGSTATIAARIFQEAGYRVGLHVKPHLEDVVERFVVDGQPISSDRLAELLQRLAPAARRVKPSWYELTVAAAFELFREDRVDLAVVEVGLGGTHDGTNVVTPEVVALTNVDLDHTEILGDTVDKIAADKAGIIKKGVTAVSGATQPGVQRIVAKRTEEVGATLWQLGRDVTVEAISVGLTGSKFDVATPVRQLRGLRTALLGAHQVSNATIAVACADAFDDRGLRASEAAVRRALRDVRVPGRLEVVRRDPLLLLDGAHNPAKMDSLVAALASLFPDRSVTGVLAFKRGHDLGATLQAIAPRLDRVIITRFDATTDYGSGQSVDPLDVAKKWRQLGRDGDPIVDPDPVCAVRRALEATPPDGLVCVTGSLYLVGVVRAWLNASP